MHASEQKGNIAARGYGPNYKPYVLSVSAIFVEVLVRELRTLQATYKEFVD